MLILFDASEEIGQFTAHACCTVRPENALKKSYFRSTFALCILVGSNYSRFMTESHRNWCQGCKVFHSVTEMQQDVCRTAFKIL